MTRTRISTTVDGQLLQNARKLSNGTTDAELIDEALRRVPRSSNRRSRRMGRPGVVPRCRGRHVSDVPRRGEVWWCEPPEVGRRPVVVLSRDAAIPRLRRALVAPCTTTIRGLASEVVLEPGDDPIGRRSAVNLDSIESVSIAVLIERIGNLGSSRMAQICGALQVATDCEG